MKIKYILLLAAVAFILNYIWEMLQMPFFAGMSFSDPHAWLICARASLGDGVIVLVIFIFGRLIFKSWNWVYNVSLIKFLYLLFTGLSVSILIEIISLKYQRWSYSDLMPVIPNIDAGIIPIIQMIILLCISYVVTLRIFSLFVKKLENDFR